MPINQIKSFYNPTLKDEGLFRYQKYNKSKLEYIKTIYEYIVFFIQIAYKYS